MSLVKAATVQIGKSSTASQNFHWRNLLDGLLRLSRGNAGDASPVDVMRVNADNSVEFPGAVLGGVIYTGQTRQNMTSQRALTTTYYNTTKLPITVTVQAIVNNNASAVEAFIQGSSKGCMMQGTMTAGINYSITFVVLPGESYSANPSGSCTLTVWWETR
jgi:hypothetical protein